MMRKILNTLNEIMEDFETRRQTVGLTRAELCERAGVHPTYYTHLTEAGTTRNPTIGVLSRLDRALAGAESERLADGKE